MTETRNQIIEIIEPYMNKTLSEGCYVKTIVKWIPRHLGITFDYVSIAHWKDSYRTLAHNWRGEYKDVHFEDPYYSEIKILWHYEITAVLKYVIKKDWFYYCDNEDANITKLYKFVDYWERWTWFEKIWNIPNKPLHLYTEQEDKELLEFLQQLKWTVNQKQ